MLAHVHNAVTRLFHHNRASCTCSPSHQARSTARFAYACCCRPCCCSDLCCSIAAPLPTQAARRQPNGPATAALPGRWTIPVNAAAKQATAFANWGHRPAPPMVRARSIRNRSGPVCRCLSPRRTCLRGSPVFLTAHPTVASTTPDNEIRAQGCDRRIAPQRNNRCLASRKTLRHAWRFLDSFSWHSIETDCRRDASLTQTALTYFSRRRRIGSAEIKHELP